MADQEDRTCENCDREIEHPPDDGEEVQYCRRCLAKAGRAEQEARRHVKVKRTGDWMDNINRDKL